MSKGDSPRPTKKKPLPIPQPNAKQKIKGGNGGGHQTAPKCWDFRLTSPTPAAREARQGMSVVGVPQGSRLIVQGSTGVLGYAPNDVASKMVATVREGHGQLIGQVVSHSGVRGEVEVKLCIE